MIVLTGRQKEVAELVARGMSRKAIATRVGISEETVKAHVRDAANRIGGEEKSTRERIVAWFYNLDARDNG